ncbi:MAG: ATP-binding protein, partial [Bdellovibrionales bacterium]
KTDDIKGLRPTYMYPQDTYNLETFVNEYIAKSIVDLQTHIHSTHTEHSVLSNIQTINGHPYMILLKEVEKPHDGKIELLGLLYVLIDLQDTYSFKHLATPEINFQIQDYYLDEKATDIRTAYKLNNNLDADDDSFVEYVDKINLDDHYFQFTAQTGAEFTQIKQYVSSVLTFIGGAIFTIFAMLFFVILAERYTFLGQLGKETTLEELETRNDQISKKAGKLWKRSIASLVIFFLIVLGAYVTAEITVVTEQGTATAINIAGRQRMLSQRISLFSNQYMDELKSGRDVHDIRQKLLQAKSLFEESHAGLIYGNDSIRLSGQTGEIAKDIYFEPPHDLDKQVNEFLRNIRLLVANTTLETKQEALRAVNKMSADRLLQSLDAVVKRLEENDQKMLAGIMVYKRTLFVATTIIIMMIGLFVTWPNHKFVLFALNEQKRLDQLRQKNKMLNQSVIEAEEANKAKSEFLANMSHELRTPLNSIIGIVQIFDQSKLEPDQRDNLDMIETSSNALLNIVNDILDLSKIEAGQVHLEYLAFDIQQKIRHTVNSLKPMASKKGLLLSHDLDSDKLYVLGDELRFGRVLINLLSNAIRYTQQGGIEVFVHIEKTFDDQVKIRCEVRDTGIGIAPDKVDKIFEKFTQADTSTTRNFGGTGLGLTITKELVEMMDGEIGVNSEQGVGSTFWFEIPFETVDEAYVQKQVKKDLNLTQFETTKDAKPVGDVHILVAEDHAMNQSFMRKLFKSLGVENYKIVENGEDALEEVMAENYDLVLMDCHMPKMNGYDATIAIRELPVIDKCGIPIIAMTANAMPEDEEKCLSIGMTGYISKPFKVEIFKKTLSTWVVFNDEHQEEDGENEEEKEEELSVNLDNLRDNAMGDEEFVKEMIEMFVSQGEKQIETLKGECTDGDNHEWVEIAHALKGTAGAVGAQTMRAKCAEAQDMADSNAKARSKILSVIETQYAAAKQYFIDEGLYEDN